MSVARLINQIKLHSRLGEDSDYSNPVIGFVSSYDPDNYCCKITIQPEDSVSGDKAMTSGWIPIGTVWCGNGWGMFCPPSIDDMVEVDFQESRFEAGHVDWRFYNDENRPVHAESGVFYLIHKTGSCLKFENDGKVTLSSTAELDLGNLATNLHQLVTDAFVSLFNSHTHQVVGVQGGSASVTSMNPTTQMNSTHLTSTVKAN